jgi:predicted PurR-regulated permease PerM
MLPLYGKLSRKMSNKISALAVITIIIIFIFALIYFVSSNLVNQITTYINEQNGSSRVFIEKVSEFISHNSKVY